MAKGAYKTENCGAFLLSTIKHSDLKVVQYEAVGQEHVITAHSAYCRFNGIKNALKAESQVEGTKSENTENQPVQISPSKKRGRKAASPTKPKGKKAKKNPNTAMGPELSGVNGTGEYGLDEDDEEQILSSPSKKQKKKKVVKVEKRAYESDESDNWLE
ncbi:hypothetical protein TWF192_002364 [Orbilia oligospora]|uniref:Myb-like DNA-binding domain-containing protein n=1 Tax=Orbilia oligospora TaxID=2813651 RepID=A0A6G1MEX8_ORBOL|nr:hypothetical protein TWF679_006766 [Orbilia oligospora]KAF3229136.1 hypothetical protein TWF191_001689 [Orbilia oligospora]KAF3255932.1 hypothetical protein TWF192_002364 [Orbilia oligospora]